MRKLDRIDRLILDILQREGRIAISELALRVNLSTTPCSERVKRLEREGSWAITHGSILPMLTAVFWCF
jgi:Lrp/AsnC family leucine-responsive transcriptional regulator